MEENRAFEQMRMAAQAPLQARAPAQLAAMAGGDWDPDRGLLTVQTLGQAVSVAVPDYYVTPELEPWHTLILLHYLANADGTPPAGRLMTFGAMRDGLIRGTKYDAASEKQLSDFLSHLTPERLRAACRALAGRELPEKCDLCVTFPLFPRFPVTMKVWFADEEFPASGKLFVDQSADHYLSVEDAVTVGDLLIERLKRELQK